MRRVRTVPLEAQLARILLSALLPPSHHKRRGGRPRLSDEERAASEQDRRLAYQRQLEANRSSVKFSELESHGPRDFRPRGQLRIPGWLEEGCRWVHVNRFPDEFDDWRSSAY